MTVQQRVAARYIKAQEEDAFNALADSWADAFVDALVDSARFDPDDVEQVLRSEGISAEEVNKLSGADKTAGFGEWVTALGGKILKGVWHMLIHPFEAAFRFVQSPTFRAEVKRAFKRALSHEVRSTKHMWEVAGRLAQGEEVNSYELKAARAQVIDILVKVALMAIAGPHITHLFQHGLMKALVALLSPIDEVLLILFDKPLRAATRKFLTSETGLLPSGFYTHWA